MGKAMGQFEVTIGGRRVPVGRIYSRKPSPGLSLADPGYIRHRVEKKIAQPLKCPLSKFSVEHMPDVGSIAVSFRTLLSIERVRAGHSVPTSFWTWDLELPTCNCQLSTVNFEL